MKTITLWVGNLGLLNPTIELFIMKIITIKNKSQTLLSVLCIIVADNFWTLTICQSLFKYFISVINSFLMSTQ